MLHANSPPALLVVFATVATWLSPAFVWIGAGAIVLVTATGTMVLDAASPVAARVCESERLE
jgi:hypothetical protein